MDGFKEPGLDKFYQNCRGMDWLFFIPIDLRISVGI